MIVQLRPARPDEAPALSELCMISKAHWGYDDGFMEACREELTISPADFDRSKICAADAEGTLAGMAQLQVEGDKAELDKLFVHPDFMGRKIGRALFDWAIAEARAAGAAAMMIDADPDAAPFYKRMGAIDAGASPSGSIPGRSLPRLRYDFAATSSSNEKG